MFNFKSNDNQDFYTVDASATQHLEILVESFWWRLLVVMGIVYFVWSEEVSINVGAISIQKSVVERKEGHTTTNFWGLFESKSDVPRETTRKVEFINNTTCIIDPTYAVRYGVPHALVSRNDWKCKRFVKKFGPVAIAEMRHFGVPASILMAQALLESDAGDELMAIKTNNYFLKSPLNTPSNSRKNAAGMHVFKNLWGSFSAQSLLLCNTVPFSNLVKSGEKDYRVWVRALVEAGYSDDPEYGKKTMALIRVLNLTELDHH